QEGNLKLAEKHYRRVIELEPHNEDVLWALGELAEQTERYVTAERYFSDITSDQRFLEAQLRVANAQYHQSGAEAAVDVLRMLEPRSIDEYVDVALTRHYILLQARELEDALGFINEAVLTAPTNLELAYARALVAAELGDVELAEADFRRILSVRPNDPDTLNAYGYTLADQTERYMEAEKMILAALEQKPNSAHILDSYGWVQYKLGDNEQALDYLQKASELSDEPEILVHLGEVLWVMGELDEAKKIWASIEVGHPLLMATLQRLGIGANFEPNKEISLR
ncbi:MAG: tetratricopeptide repeat protein, partial [Pseudomonadota bacterium]